MPKPLNFAVCLVCLLPLPLFAQQAAPITSGMKIQAAVQLRPGTYTLEAHDAGAIQVSGKNFTLDFKGVDLVGKGRKGVGLAVTNAENVTIKNLRVSEFLWGVRLEKCKGVKFIDCVSSFNGDLTPGSVIDESGAQPEDQWGGGFLLRDSEHCHLLRCVAQYQWDGVDLVRSHHNVIEQGDNSYNGNWGIHLWNSSNNVYRKNKAIWCTTGAGTLYQALTGWSTMDAQAVGIDHNSNENLIEANDLRFGGDAIFIRANEGPVTPGTVVPPKNSSDRNILRNNDCSFSPNNAIEVDLVDGTIIEGNNCSFSNYGLWLGYSRHSVVRNNICIDDSTNAVEIENGQFNTFENNIFGYSAKRERPEGHLVFLRKNNNDKTPSQGYVFRNNLFYGARTGVLLHGTSASFGINTIIWRDLIKARVAEADSGSHIDGDTVKSTGFRVQRDADSDDAPEKLAGLAMKSGARFTLAGSFGDLPPLILMDGVPLWVISHTKTQAVCWLPSDCWLKPSNQSVSLEALALKRQKVKFLAPDRADDGSFVQREWYRWKKYQALALEWNPVAPRIESLSPNPSRIGDVITVRGKNLAGGRILLNNQPAKIVRQDSEQISFQIPDALTPRSYNLIFERGEKFNRVRTAPIVVTQEIPRDQLPHILSATFSPTRLKVGEILTVEFTVKNNLPIPARLATKPAPPYLYEEGQAFWEKGFSDVREALHLRVTSDHPLNHDPGSWPWLFGFEKATLQPGETTTVTGRIRVQTAGVIEFRVGLVPGGHGFIDDNAFRTKITIER